MIKARLPLVQQSPGSCVLDPLTLSCEAKGKFQIIDLGILTVT